MTKRKQFLVAMSGGSGSGKSTLAEALLEHLPEGQAVLFGEDAYYYPMSHYGEPGNKEEWTALVAGINYDAPRSKEADRLVKDVDTPDDLRLARRIRRDVTERGRSLESVLQQYLGTVRAAHYQWTYPAKFEADLVIADEGLPAYGNVRPTEEAIERMIAPVLARLQNCGAI